MVFPHRACGFAAGAAPIPVYGWDRLSSLPLKPSGAIKNVCCGRGELGRPGEPKNPYRWRSREPANSRIVRPIRALPVPKRRIVRLNRGLAVFAPPVTLSTYLDITVPRHVG